MNSKELRNLTESYYEIYEESDSNIRASKLGARLKDQVNRNPEGANATTNRYLDLVANLRIRNKQPRDSSEVMKNFRRGYALGEEIESILDYLVQEGYANSLESAEILLENMSDEWLMNILNEGALESVLLNRLDRERMEREEKRHSPMRPKVRPSFNQRPRGKSSTQPTRGQSRQISAARRAANQRRDKKLKVAGAEASARSSLDRQARPRLRTLAYDMLAQARERLGLNPKYNTIKDFNRGGTKNENYELYNYILEAYDELIEYLIQEGYANSLGSAEIILENMSDEWLNDVLQEIV